MAPVGWERRRWEPVGSVKRVGGSVGSQEGRGVVVGVDSVIFQRERMQPVGATPRM